MPVQEEVLNALKCCFLNDGHIAIEPILASCDAIGCKEWIASSKTEEIECYNCKGQNSIKVLKNTPIIKSNESLVKSFVNDLIENYNGI